MQEGILASTVHPSTTQEKVIEISHLTKKFGDRTVLSDVSMDLYERENLVVLGKSGSGKSVLIKCIAGLLRPESGSILVLGSEVLKLNSEELDKLRLKIGFSFQGSALYDSMTVKQNLEFPLKRTLGIYDRDELDERVHDSLKEMGLQHTLNQMPDELSGGMRKRIGIARTLILKPKIMLYDEPTAGLDPITSADINDLILHVRDKYATSSIVITHDISCARHVSDRIIALVDGTCKLSGTFEELKAANDKDISHFFNY